MRIAVLDLEGKAVDANTSAMVSDLLRTEMFKTGLFIVVERGEMNKILAEQGLQASGCTDTECAVEMGKMLAARKMLLGTIGRLGSSFHVNARIVDVEAGTLDFAESAQAASEDELAAAVKAFASSLTARMTGGKIRVPVPPSAGKVYPYRTLGFVLGGAGVAAFAVGVVEHILLSAVKSDLDSLRNEANDLESAYLEMESGDLDASWQAYQDAFEAAEAKAAEQSGPATGAVVGYAIGGALIATGAFLTFYSRPSGLAVRVTPDGTLAMSYRF
jgi:hypothetical protein